VNSTGTYLKDYYGLILQNGVHRSSLNFDSSVAAFEVMFIVFLACMYNYVVYIFCENTVTVCCCNFEQ